MGSDVLQARVASSEARQKTTEERTAGECPGCPGGGAVGLGESKKTETFQIFKQPRMKKGWTIYWVFYTHMEWWNEPFLSEHPKKCLGNWLIKLGRNALWRPRWTCWMPSWMAWCENLKGDKPSVFLSRSCGLVPCHVTTYQYQNENCEKQCLWEYEATMAFPSKLERDLLVFQLGLGPRSNEA